MVNFFLKFVLQQTLSLAFVTCLFVLLLPILAKRYKAQMLSGELQS